MVKKDKLRPETLSLHAGHDPFAATPMSRAVPIHMTTSYMFRDTDHAARLYNLEEEGFIYTRLHNPTTDVLEQRLAALYGGSGAVALSSGHAAVSHAVLNICSSGHNIVSGSNLYGGTHTLFSHTLPRWGVRTRFVDSSEPENFARAIDRNTQALFTEAIGNPLCNVDNLRAIADVAHEHNIPLILDGTVAPPPMFDPFSVGVDIVALSLTKIIGGHGVAMGGAVIEAGTFNWEASGRFQEITEPDPSYHGVVFWEGAEALKDRPSRAYTLKMVTGLLRNLGACISPMNSFFILQGLETLPLRAKVHCDNAGAVAEFLDKHEAVTWVTYAGLPDHPDHERAKEYFPLGPGALFGFGVAGGVAAGRKFIESVKLCSHLANILDAKTLVIHPASTTHAQLAEEEMRHAGVAPDMVRISVGLENVEDIIADLDQALAASQA
ncbi:MAG: aminotransferase class V-fold PLP-dependent enzyme [Desulfovibrio sp.]|nr:MAG: aminotransferase class V-fold PLP-dependent enzyme [Desulfovibrio sp.]